MRGLSSCLMGGINNHASRDSLSIERLVAAAAEAG
jgi:hypothetical protein